MKSYIHLIVTASLMASLLSSCSDREIRFNGGVYKGDATEEVPSGYGVWKNDSVCYAGFWKDGRYDGQGILTHRDTVYRGGFKDGRFNGAGTLACGDSILYSGNWEGGMRHGDGYVRDSLNREILALWDADSIVSGVRNDSNGIYVGMLDKNFIPNGRGSYSYGNMQFYEGSWLNDKPHDFGIQLAPDGWLRVGTWKKGKFKGEELTYTADRIYGIDIARYQHKTPIRWDKLRITSLGRISKKKITGKVDYPVSFVYIKCTEGETVQNKYYDQDYRAARRHGISCGAYHFFSIHSEPEKQAENFLRHLKLKEGDFPPVLDVEPSEREIREIGGNIELFKRIRTWLHIVENKTGMRPILYINQMFVNRHMPYAPDLARKYQVWIARYGEYKPDLHMVYWQLAPDGFVRGITGHVDINVFNGYRPAYDRYLRKKTYKGKLPDDNR